MAPKFPAEPDVPSTSEVSTLETMNLLRPRSTSTVTPARVAVRRTSDKMAKRADELDIDSLFDMLGLSSLPEAAAAAAQPVETLLQTTDQVAPSIPVHTHPA